MNERANLDQLRALAVLAVLVDHLMPTLELYVGVHNQVLIEFLNTVGHAGVLAFFVHTSLVLMDSLARLQAPFSVMSMKFYVRRFFRIYPLSIFTILMVVALGLPPTAWRETPPVGKAVIVSNLLLVQNIVAKQEVLEPMWSLPYEVQMYVVLPALYVLARRRRGALYVVALIAFFPLLEIVLRHFKTGFLSVAGYAPCFLAGVLCYALRRRIRPVLPAWLWPPFLIALIFSFCFVNRHEISATYWSGWVYCLILALAINLFHDSEYKALNFTAKKAALYSYGMYLMHVPVLYLVFIQFDAKSLVLGSAAYFSITLVAAIATFHLIEGPCIALGKRLTSPSKRGLTDADVLPAP